MDSTKYELQAIMRKLYSFLPVELAYSCSMSILTDLVNPGFISLDEYASLKAICKAYSDILGG